MTAANRGKFSEGKVKKELDILATLSNFDYERITDAYSSRGGASASRPGDFLAFQAGKSVILEVKEFGHDFRLPKSNFKVDQRARMMKRHYAGCLCYVLMYSTTACVWWMLPITEFGVDATGSWDLRETPANSLHEHLETIFEFPWKGKLC